MRKDILEQMLASVDGKYIAETIEAEKERTVTGRRKKSSAAAAVVGLLLLGSGISAAASSDVFRSWLAENFSGQEITRVEVYSEKCADSSGDEEQCVDDSVHFSLEENMEIYGEKESFVCRYHWQGDDEIVDQVYMIQDQGLEKAEKRDFHGKYDGKDFSFSYTIINQEILGFNLSESVGEVFHYVDGDNVYVSLCEVKDETCVKGCIARLNLRTGDVIKLTDDTVIGNMVMSPHGKVILINYRSEGYWTAFDLDSSTEKKMEEINGYAHTNEVIFQDDDHVLTLGDVYMDGDTEIMGAKCIDLRTGERTASYRECGDFDLAWLYRQEGDTLTVKHVDGTTAVNIENVEGYPHPLSSRGGYVLLGDPEETDTPFYICNLAGKWYRKINVPAGLRENVEMYFAAREGKILLTDGKDAYLVDVSGKTVSIPE